MSAQLVGNQDRLQEAAQSLASNAGLDGAFRLHPLAGGANNRVFRIDGAGWQALLKAYFQHPMDPRDRLGAEFGFATFAWQQGVRGLPRPLGCDRTSGLGLYEFVHGRPLRADDPLDDAVGQALTFFSAVNRHKHLPEAARLPRASESCFSLAEHFATVERRVLALGRLTGEAPVEREAWDFVCDGLAPRWQAVAAQARQRAADLGLDLADEQPGTDRCLSPSDFGFHNAILGDDGRVRFLDFEYAGWDDPAKLICDFFCQPALPAPSAAYEPFARRVVAGLSDPERQYRRAELLLPAYRIKWCCILLNDFLPAGGERRRFASPTDQLQRKETQLAKARRALGAVDW